MIYRLVKRNLFSGFRLASNQHWLSYGLTPTRSTRRGLNQSWSRNLTPWINQLNVSNIKKLARLTLETYCPLNHHDQNSVKVGWKYKYILSRKCILNVAFKMPTILFKPRCVDIVQVHTRSSAGYLLSNDAELWCFFLSAPEQTVEQTNDMPVIWDTFAPIVTSLGWPRSRKANTTPADILGASQYKDVLPV